jgi:integrase
MLEERSDVGKALTADQERMLLAECAASVSRSLLPFVVLAIDTGARYDTVRTLQWGRVDLKKGSIKIGKDKTQAGTGRVVPLNDRALKVLSNWAEHFPGRKPEHYVFPSEMYGLVGKKGKFGGSVKSLTVDPTRPVGSIKTGWENAKLRTRRRCPKCLNSLKDAKPKGFKCGACGLKLDELPEGVTGFRFHDLRHTSVSRMIVGGVALPVIAKVVGWRLGTVVSMAQRYGHFEQETMRKAVDAIGLAYRADPRAVEEKKGETIQ